MDRSGAFREVFDRGRSHPGRFLVLWVRGDGSPSYRLGVVASRRTFRKAVQRSRAKRLLREAFRLNRHKLAGGGDIVLIGRRRILGTSRPGVDADLLRVAGRAGILGAPERE